MRVVLAQGSVETLQMEQRLEEFDASIADLRRQLCNAQARARGRCCRDSVVAAYQLDVALRACVLTSYDMNAAVEVLARVVAKRAACTPAGKEAWPDLEERGFLAKAPETLAAMSDWASDNNRLSARTAKKLVREYRL